MVGEAYQYKYSELFKRMSNHKHISWHMKYWATMHLEDQEQLQKIATKESHPVVRQEAVRKITDEDTLFQIAVDDENMNVRRVAIEGISDKMKLLKLRIMLESELQPLIRHRVRNITEENP